MKKSITELEEEYKLLIDAKKEREKRIELESKIKELRNENSFLYKVLEFLNLR